MNKNFTISALLLALSATGCAVTSAPETSQAYVQASAADTATTAVVLGTGMGFEANPVGFAGATLAKAGLYYYAKDLPEAEQKQVYKTGSSAFGGVSINNLLVLLGAPTGLSILAGTISALVIYSNKEDAPVVAQTPALTVAQGEAQ